LLLSSSVSSCLRLTTSNMQPAPNIPTVRGFNTWGGRLTSTPSFPSYKTELHVLYAPVMMGERRKVSDALAWTQHAHAHVRLVLERETISVSLQIIRIWRTLTTMCNVVSKSETIPIARSRQRVQVSELGPRVSEDMTSMSAVLWICATTRAWWLPLAFSVCMKLIAKQTAATKQSTIDTAITHCLLSDRPPGSRRFFSSSVDLAMTNIRSPMEGNNATLNPATLLGCPTARIETEAGLMWDSLDKINWREFRLYPWGYACSALTDTMLPMRFCVILFPSVWSSSALTDDMTASSVSCWGGCPADIVAVAISSKHSSSRPEDDFIEAVMQNVSKFKELDRAFGVYASLSSRLQRMK
jgi:hypothetical protein